jgi:allantoin racemase
MRARAGVGDRVPGGERDHDLAAALAGELGIPVVDGVAAAVKIAESLVALGLPTSKRDEYAVPPAKPVTRLHSSFALRRD